ncbi:hypothetical protein BOTBODRAFT_169166 [Botryobasidium botryosum FD-172 SS1]|uniref:Protein kinase domain-containing protein n=1 Tax=Botryobasidium botryosum (strain FD-172 SS1) TaxID=930990 RepID=A0A067MXE0_BOTB1|nr:hypothetical protein BOTBODRAFT_169166 [Botryobasidium botryosum FD-172 SS1]
MWEGSATKSPDALDTPWVIPVVSDASVGTRGHRRSTRLASRTAESLDGSTEPISDASYGQSTKTAELTPRRWVQQAWAQAVLYDTTLFMLYSGNYEFICIEVGLYIAGIEDAIDRAMQLRVMESDPLASDEHNASNPRHGEDDDKVDRERSPDTRLSKRRRGDGETEIGRSGGDGKGEKARPLNVASECQVAYLFLRYGIYDSKNPAIFHRAENWATLGNAVLIPPPPPYGPCESIALVLISDMAEGATGVVHSAVLEVETPGGEYFTHKVVVKLAFAPKQQTRLRNEHAIYEYLESQGVRGLVTIFGLFVDAEEGGPLALVMSHAGTPLRSGKVSATVEKLGEIHKAGVIHGDIRAQNLLVNESGEVTVIDFDAAFKCASRRAAKREHGVLHRVLKD